MKTCKFPNSAMLERAAYEPDLGELWLSFIGAGRYVYDKVPGEVFDALCGAHSPGSFVNSKIKGHYRCRRDPERRRFGPTAKG